MHTLLFSDIAACAVHVDGATLRIGTVPYAADTVIVGNHWQLSSAVVHNYLATYAHVYGERMHIPTAAVVFDITHELDALAHFLPIIHILDRPQRATFLAQLNTLLHHPQLTISGYRHKAVMALPLSARALIAGQIVMCFFYRPELITILLQTSPSFALFHGDADYAQAGGVGGGCYDVRTHQVLILISRLYEGFFGRTPGVCPLLHEFGHMLDGTSMRHMRYSECRGELPGMNETQMHAFADAKAREYACYMAHYHGRAPADGTYPLGHPYVFQTDGEFLAGYWEMFWRNPHTMAQRCPALFAVWCEYTQCDPRDAFPHDYMGYVDGNKAFYRSGERPWPSQIRFHIR